MTSERICTNSMRSRGTAASIFARTSSMTSAVERSRWLSGLRRTTMSPRFCSVANRPSSAPVRRDVPVISGVWREDLLDDVQLPIRLGERRAAGAEVVEHERAFVDLGQESRRHEGVDEDAGADEHQRDRRSSSARGGATRRARARSGRTARRSIRPFGPRRLFPPMAAPRPRPRCPPRAGTARSAAG